MRLAVAFALLATVAGAAHAASVPHNDVPPSQKEHHRVTEEASAAAHNLLRGRHHHRRRRNHRHLQADQAAAQPAETKWDNNRISETNPDGLQLDPETGKPDCFEEPCYAHHYDGPVDVGDVNRVVDVPNPNPNPNPADEAVEQAALQLALAEAQAATATRNKPNPNIVYDYSTGYKYDLSTGQKIAIEEVEHASVSSGQEKVDVKVYIVEEKVPTDQVVVPGLGPLDDPTPAQATCAKALYDETCTGDDQCESGCCATLPTKGGGTVTKCVEPRYPVFNQYCPVRNPCRTDAESQGTMVPEEEARPAPPSQAQGGEPAKPTYVHSAIPQPAGSSSAGGAYTEDGEKETGGTLYTVGTFTASGADPSSPSNPNRVVGGGGATDSGNGTTAAVDCTKDKKADWPMGKVPTANQCEASCQCDSGCCVKYWFQICVDKTANQGRWADSCI